MAGDSRDARPFDGILEVPKNGEKGAGDHCRQPVLHGAHSLGPGVYPFLESLRALFSWWRTAAGGVLERAMEHRTSPATPDRFYQRRPSPKRNRNLAGCSQIAETLFPRYPGTSDLVKKTSEVTLGSFPLMRFRLPFFFGTSYATPCFPKQPGWVMR